MARRSIYIIFLALLFLFTSLPYADQQNEIIENIENGSINWSKGFLKATGTGLMRFKYCNAFYSVGFRP
jgi:hypothetical protein